MHRTKKLPVIAVTMIVVGGAGFELWTPAGAARGSGEPGTLAALQVRQTSTVTALGPGPAPQPLSGVFDNRSNQPVYVTEVSAAVTQVNDAAGHPAAGCSASDFTIAGTGSVNAEVPAGTGVGAWRNLTIAFDSKTGSNQDACQNAQLVIGYNAT